MTTNQTEKTNRFRNSISLKLIIVAILSLLLLIPSFMVKELIDEREGRRNATITEVTEKWGTSQTITGPVLIIPYIKRKYHTTKKYTDHKHYFHILPSELNIDGELLPQIRKRGIYKVITYNSELIMQGNFNSEDISNWPDSYTSILWEEARISLGIRDLRGVTENIVLNWNNTNYNFSAGKANCVMYESGINTKVTVLPDSNYSFNLNIKLNGSKSINFTPTGSSTQVSLKSGWNSPSFDGSFLPLQREVTDSAFTATWSVIEMNRNFPQNFTGESYDRYHDFQEFGVKLIMPVATYQKATRSVKYSFLFIALTFLIVFFSEITGKKRIHPVQYLIIGIGLVIFYSLLISLAEHFNFNIAYMVSSLVIIAMITAYIKALFKNWKPTIIIGGLLTILYLFLFTILQIADYALLLGNIGLVLILGLVMLYSKKVDWYSSQQKNNSETDKIIESKENEETQF